MEQNAESKSRWVSCPNCSTMVDLDAATCPKCRNAMPGHGRYAPIWAKESSSARFKRLGKRVLVGLILIALVALASYGYLAYERQQDVLRASWNASKNAEAAAVHDAVNHLQIVCLTHRAGTQVWGGFVDGYGDENETIGIHNASQYDMRIGWSLVMNYWSVRRSMQDSVSSHLFGFATVQPTFALVACSGMEICLFPSCLISLPPSCDGSIFDMSLQGQLNVTGAYGNYIITSVSTYNSTSQKGTGLLASNSTNIPLC